MLLLVLVPIWGENSVGAVFLENAFTNFKPSKKIWVTSSLKVHQGHPKIK